MPKLKDDFERMIEERVDQIMSDRRMYSLITEICNRTLAKQRKGKLTRDDMMTIVYRTTGHHVANYVIDQIEKAYSDRADQNELASMTPASTAIN
jgi:hypothetical protein